MKKRDENKRESSSDFINGFGLGLLFTSPVFAWSFGSFLQLSSPTDLTLTLLIGLSMIFIGKKSLKLGSVFLKQNFVFIFLNILFLILLIHINDEKNIGWILYALMLMMVQAVRYSVIDTQKFLSGFFVAAIIAILGYLSTNSDSILDSMEIAGTTRISFENQAFTLAAYSAAALVYISTFRIFYSNVSSITSFFSFLGLFLGLVSVSMAGARSVYGGILLSVVYIYFITNKKNDVSLLKRSFLVITFIVVVVAIFQNESMLVRMENQFYRIFDGVQTLFQENVSLDDSAEGRKLQRRYAVDSFIANPILGNGIKSYWVDFPLLQIFSDLGILVGLIYCFFVAIIPLTFLYNVYNKNDVNLHVKFIGGLYLLNFPRLFLHGQPYDWTIYIFLVPVLVHASRQRIYKRF